MIHTAKALLAENPNPTEEDIGIASPQAHARVVEVDGSAAEAHPKVKAVITVAHGDEEEVKAQ